MKSTRRTVSFKTLQGIMIAMQAKKTITNNYRIKENASDLEKLVDVAHHAVIVACKYMYNSAKNHGKSLEFVKDLQLLTSSQRLQYVQRINAGWAIERAYATENDHVQSAFTVLYQYCNTGQSAFDKTLPAKKRGKASHVSPFNRATSKVQYDILRRYKKDRSTDYIEDKQAKGEQLTNKASKIEMVDYDIIISWLDNSPAYKKQPQAKKRAIKTLLVWIAKGYNVTQASQKAGVSSKTGYNYLDMIKPDIIKQV